jgi:hypothetical protein
MKKIFYEKQGRKYVPVSEYDSDLLDAFPKGAHLIITTPGHRTTQYKIDPAYAPMIAAGRIAEEAITDVIRQALDLRPSREPITQEQLDAWTQLAKAFGDDVHTLTRASARDAAEAAVKAMQTEAERLMAHPTVREAYEHFLFVAKLAADEDKETTK